MSNESKSNQHGVLKEGTTGIRPGSLSTNAANPSTLGTSDTTAKAKSPKDSQLMNNLQDNPNAARLIMALAAKLGTLVEWKRLKLGDGREVYALVFPVGKWFVDPETKELRPR
jgi:hypothetical protein